jgi:hypothetical protein
MRWMLVCVLLVSRASWAQTTIVCDPGGDASYLTGKGVPPVPSWLDMAQVSTTLDGTGENLLFTMAVNEPIPEVPAWNEGRAFWWGWRIRGSLDDVTFVKNGCFLANGHPEPTAYFLDLVWSVRTSSFVASLIDDTGCTAIDVPFLFSPDRHEFTLVVSRRWFSNRDLIADPDHFFFFAKTMVSKAGQTGNDAFFDLDHAPDPVPEIRWNVAAYSAETDFAVSCDEE